MPRESSRYRDRDRRSSSYSTDSSYDRKKSKKHRRRSSSRDRSESSYKRRRSVSRSRKRRSYSRSLSRDRYESRSRKRSTSRSRSKRSNRRDSRDRSRSKSSTRSRSKHSKKHKKSRRSSSSSRGSSFDIEKPTVSERPVNLDDTNTKIEKAIKAAEAAGLTMTKIPTYEYKEVEIKEDMPTIHDRNLLAELNNDSFVQKAFTSSKSKKNQNILIDLEKETVTVADTDLKVSKEDSIINFDAIPSQEELTEMWIKKLYQFRKKMLKGEI